MLSMDILYGYFMIGVVMHPLLVRLDEIICCGQGQKRVRNGIS